MIARPKTKREMTVHRQVLDHLVIAWLGMGLTIGEIASNLKRSNKVIEWRWQTIKEKYRLQSYVDCAHYAIAHKLIPLKFECKCISRTQF